MTLKSQITALFAASICFVTVAPQAMQAVCALPKPECEGTEKCYNILPKEFWQLNPDCWPADTKTKMLNGKLWISILTDKGTPDSAWSYLAKEWIVAKLNIAINPGLENEPYLKSGKASFLDQTEKLLTNPNQALVNYKVYTVHAEKLKAFNASKALPSKVAPAPASAQQVQQIAQAVPVIVPVKSEGNAKKPNMVQEIKNKHEMRKHKEMKKHAEKKHETKKHAEKKKSAHKKNSHKKKK